MSSEGTKAADPVTTVPKMAVIIGGGLGGLAAAVALQAKGWNVCVFERDASARDRRQGYGMTLQPSPAMEELGLLGPIRAAHTESDEHYQFTPDGHVVGYYGRLLGHSDGGERPCTRGNLRVPRGTVRGFLLEKLRPGTITFGAKFTHYEESDSGVTAFFEEPHAPVRGDVLVGSDGIYSRVRRQLVGDDLSYMGVCLMLGISSLVHPLLQERGFYTLDGHHRMFTMPFAVGDGVDSPPLTMWQLSFTAPVDTLRGLEAMGPEALRAEALRRCGAWHAPVPEMIAAPSEYDTWVTGLYDYGDSKAFINTKRQRRRVTLIGDAAHPMSPFKGQGANQALRDGPLLAAWLSKVTISTGLLSFEREMMTRAQDKVAASRAAAVHLHSPAAIAPSTRAMCGVKDDDVPGVVEAARAAGLGSWCGAGLAAELAKLVPRH